MNLPAPLGNYDKPIDRLTDGLIGKLPFQQVSSNTAYWKCNWRQTGGLFFKADYINLNPTIVAKYYVRMKCFFLLITSK